MAIQKRFPADTQMEILTFLNDKKIDDVLYAYLLELSMGEDGETIVKKKDIPKQGDAIKELGMKSPKTYREHLNYLIEQNYIQKKDNGDLVFTKKEDMFFMIPLETLRYLKSNCRAHVYKIYVYLGQRYKYALSKGKQYEFSMEELGEHCGIRVKNNSEGYRTVKYALELLANSGLINYVSFFNGSVQKKKLIGFSLEYHKIENG